MRDARAGIPETTALVIRESSKKKRIGSRKGNERQDIEEDNAAALSMAAA